MNIVHELWQTVHGQGSPESLKRGLGQNCPRTICQRTLANFHEKVHKTIKNGGLVNIVHELWQIVHEQCSPEPIW